MKLPRMFRGALSCSLLARPPSSGGLGYLSGMQVLSSRESVKTQMVYLSSAVISSGVSYSMRSGTFCDPPFYGRSIGPTFVTHRNVQNWLSSVVRSEGRHSRQVWRVEGASCLVATREEVLVEMDTTSNVRLGARPARIAQKSVEKLIMPILSAAGGGLFFFWCALPSKVSDQKGWWGV
jgi:hypothetical protein